MNFEATDLREKGATSANSGFKKLLVQWLEIQSQLTTECRFHLPRHK